MEPTPEEWPTPNGFFSPSCANVPCQCQPLTAARLRGYMIDYPNYIHQAVLQALENVTAAATINTAEIAVTANLTAETTSTMPTPTLHSAQVFHSIHTDHNFVIMEKDGDELLVQYYQNASRNETVCVPECLPATWRADVAHAVLSLVPLTHPEPSLPISTVHMVPTFVQLVSRPRDVHSSASRIYDCTHRSFDAIVTINEQLIRAMLRMEL